MPHKKEVVTLNETEMIALTQIPKSVDNNRHDNDDKAIYRSGIAALRTSSHRVKASPKHRNFVNTSQKSKKSLPPLVCQEDVLAYDTFNYPLREALTNLLAHGCDPTMVGTFSTTATTLLPALEDFVVPPNTLHRKVNGGCCEEAQAYMSEAVACDAEFLNVFDRLVQEVILPHLQDKLLLCHDNNNNKPLSFYVQRPPTVRIQPGPARAGVKPHHDGEYGHQPGELNVWIPLTDRTLTNVDLWCESTPGAADYHALPATIGDILIFHGSQVKHFVNRNDTPKTRMSLDFRIGVEGYFDPTFMMDGTTDDHGRKVFPLDPTTTTTTTSSSSSLQPSSASASGASPTTTTTSNSTRRSLLASLLALTVGHAAAIPSHCQALPVEEGEGGGDVKSSPRNDDGRGGKPFAPLAALLPATRLKFVVDQMYDLSNNLRQTTDQNARYQILVQMNDLWVQKPQVFQSRQERIPAKSSTTAASIAGQITTGVSTANKQQYQSNRQNLEGATKIMAMWNQADVERQWGMLQYQESKRNAQNELRAALTTYTSQLEYSAESYLLTANADERKRLIRNDALPSLTAVIASDLDLRDLYRNEFVTAMEDAEAEVTYQLKQQGTDNSVVDVADVVELLEKAHSSLQKWFDLIAAADVREAMEVVKDEQQQNAGKAKG